MPAVLDLLVLLLLLAEPLLLLLSLLDLLAMGAPYASTIRPCAASYLYRLGCVRTDGST